MPDFYLAGRNHCGSPEGNIHCDIWPGLSTYYACDFSRGVVLRGGSLPAIHFGRVVVGMFPMIDDDDRTHVIAFRLTGKEMKRLISETMNTKEFSARSPHEAARFIVAKKLGFWFRPVPSGARKSLRNNR